MHFTAQILVLHQSNYGKLDHARQYSKCGRSSLLVSKSNYYIITSLVHV